MNDPSSLQNDVSAIKIQATTQQKAKAFVAERGYFDTHSFIKDMMQSGFTQEQSEELCRLFKAIVNYVAHDFKTECLY